MKKQRIYLDTSVFGGYYDDEFQEWTKPLFERISNGEFTILISTMLDEELEFAPERIKNLLADLNDSFTEFLKDKDEAISLATEYIDENVVGKTSYADCLHIALATIYQADLLVSWNFKHIVNVERIRGYNSINLKNGYKQLDIRSPRELMKYGN
ncbi:PIN domain-containing protein [Mesohalobacter halotolerans]|uniref:Type II toxin-antitoxin system VapC family toxin n=1 Tax=Mesohalobacter halotolerans TaxID=1883405 RepID=A0A4V6ALK1_9FLAO|nr:PIN domain-containing protein [Mesohalobacter halotolerans]MBS3738268.1 PIN domain-containing protein [Psychroflexus sp.]TKS57175.1 type II toxin-antitoxin system VapC family toxin [Mesohalobacter halotolerans]